MPPSHYRVALAFEPQGKSYLTQVAAGIFQQSLSQPDLDYEVAYPWFSLRLGTAIEEILAAFDGFISGVRWHSLPKLQKRPQPTITVGPEGLLLEKFPWVGPDYAAIGHLAGAGQNFSRRLE